MKKYSTSYRLKQIMSERNLKQIDILNMAKPFCEAYGVKLNKNDLSQYVSGKVEPGQNKLFILGLALNVNEAWLMGFDISPNRSKIEEHNDFSLSAHEKKVMIAYRNKVDMQPAVDRLLGVEDEILIPTVKAARSDGNNQPIEIVNLPDLSKFEPDDTDL